MLNLVALLVFCSVLFAAGGVLRQRQSRRRLAALVKGEVQEATPWRSERPLDHLERLARQAGLRWQRQHFLTFALAGAAGALLASVTGHLLLALTSLLAGTWLPYRLVLWRRRLRADQFRSQLPAALFLMASCLRAGGSVMQAVDAVVQKAEDPLAGEFIRAQQALRLQEPPSRALALVQERIGLEELTVLVVATGIACDVGGNLAELYEHLGQSLVERQNLQAALRTQTTEGRASALVITAIPVVVLGFLQLTNPEYFAPLWQSWGGRLLGLSSGLAMFLGWRWIRRITEVSF